MAEFTIVVNVAEYNRLKKLEERVKGIVILRADELCWRDVYTELAELVGVPFNPELIEPVECHLANCEAFIKSLHDGGPYTPVYVEPKKLNVRGLPPVSDDPASENRSVADGRYKDIGVCSKLTIDGVDIRGRCFRFERHVTTHIGKAYCYRHDATGHKYSEHDADGTPSYVWEVLEGRIEAEFSKPDPPQAPPPVPVTMADDLITLTMAEERRQWHEAHSHCPRCGYGNVFTTTMGIGDPPPGTPFLDDHNRAHCKCGWSGKVNQLVPQAKGAV